LYVGWTYNFSLATTSAHPWYIGTDPTGEGAGFLYGGQSTGNFIYTPSASDAASTLYYQCEIHPNLGNALFVTFPPQSSSSAVSLKSSSSSVAQASSSTSSAASSVATLGTSVTRSSSSSTPATAVSVSSTASSSSAVAPPVTAAGRLCFLTYSLPGNVDYPW
jgi:hypothetical protein